MWGTDDQWLNVSLHLALDSNEHTVRTNVVCYLDANPDERKYAKLIMEENGVWEQALQLAKELDLKIEPNEND